MVNDAQTLCPGWLSEEEPVTQFWPNDHWLQLSLIGWGMNTAPKSVQSEDWDRSCEVIRKCSLVLPINKHLLRKTEPATMMYAKDLLWWFDFIHLWELVRVLAGSLHCLGAEPEVTGRAEGKKRWTWTGEEKVQLESVCPWHPLCFLPDFKSAASLLSVTHVRWHSRCRLAFTPGQDLDKGKKENLGKLGLQVRQLSFHPYPANKRSQGLQ